MRLKILLLFIFLISCASTSRKNLLNEEIIRDHKQCLSYGFNKGSFEFKNCIKRLHEQRELAKNNQNSNNISPR